jgi:hypothetical protein
MEDLFTNRTPNSVQAEMMDLITDEMLGVWDLLEQLPNSRFRSLAMTKLEECSMWAKKATVFTYAVDFEAAPADASAATEATTESGG